LEQKDKYLAGPPDFTAFIKSCLIPVSKPASDTRNSKENREEVWKKRKRKRKKKKISKRKLFIIR